MTRPEQPPSGLPDGDVLSPERLLRLLPAHQVLPGIRVSVADLPPGVAAIVIAANPNPDAPPLEQRAVVIRDGDPS